MKLLPAADLPVETWERFGPFEIEVPLSDMPTILFHSKIDIRGTKHVFLESLRYE